MEHVSHKLKNAVEGALAGQGDPATSPLYVFGPFLKLTDGGSGSGFSEEEFGGWADKINAS